MTNKQKIRKLRAEIKAIERETARLKSLPPVNVHRLMLDAFAKGWRGDAT